MPNGWENSKCEISLPPTMITGRRRILGPSLDHHWTIARTHTWTIANLSLASVVHRHVNYLATNLVHLHFSDEFADKFADEFTDYT